MAVIGNAVFWHNGFHNIANLVRQNLIKLALYGDGTAGDWRNLCK